MLTHRMSSGTKETRSPVNKTEIYIEWSTIVYMRSAVEALAHYRYEKEEFEKEVAIFRNKFFKSIEAGGLAGDRRGAVPASAFSVSVQKMWKVIKVNKDLDLPAHKEWLELKELVESNVVPGFGKKLSSLLAISLSGYDKEATYFDESVGASLLSLAQPTIKLILEHITSGTLKNFKKELADALIKGQGFSLAARHCTQKFTTLFDTQCQDASNITLIFLRVHITSICAPDRYTESADIVIEQEKWDLAKVRDTFSANLASHIVEVRTSNLSKLTALYETKLEKALHGPVEVLLKGGTDCWAKTQSTGLIPNPLENPIEVKRVKTQPNCQRQLNNCQMTVISQRSQRFTRTIATIQTEPIQPLDRTFSDSINRNNCKEQIRVYV
ncbi:protein root hair defective 3 [Tanacetum coccineum]